MPRNRSNACFAKANFGFCSFSPFHDVMTAPPPLNLPGYLWDGKRFYKAPPQSKQPTQSASTSQELTSSKKRKKSTSNRSDGKRVGQGTKLSTRSSLHEQLRDLALREWSNPPSEQLHQFSQLSVFLSLYLLSGLIVGVLSAM